MTPENVKDNMKKDIDVLFNADDDVVGYAIIVTRKSHGSSMAMQGKTNALLGAMEQAKYALLTNQKGIGTRDEFAEI